MSFTIVALLRVPISLSLISLLKISLDNDGNEECVDWGDFSSGNNLLPNANFFDNLLNTASGSLGGNVRIVGVGDMERWGGTVGGNEFSGGLWGALEGIS